VLESAFEHQEPRDVAVDRAVRALTHLVQPVGDRQTQPLDRQKRDGGTPRRFHVQYVMAGHASCARSTPE
jgi:hypothetical protein